MVNMRYGLMKRAGIMLLIFAFILMNASPVVYADDSSLDVSGSKTASPTELSGDERETTVTLKMPAGEYSNKVDIVFVMDNSTSVANAGLDFSDNAASLFSKIVEENEGVELKIGVVKFRGYATDMLGTGLTEYADSSKDTIVNAIANNTVPGSGSNMHSGMVMAEQMLSADTEVEDSQKYVILLTDCKSYIWNNSSNEPTTYYAQWAKATKVQASGKPALSQYSGIYNKESGSSYGTFVVDGNDIAFNMLTELGLSNATDTEDSSAYYQQLYDCGNAEIASTGTEYDSPAYYSKYPGYSYTGNTTAGDGTVTARTLTNGSALFPSNANVMYRTYYDYTPDESTFWKDIKYLQLNPYEVVNADGSYSYDPDKVNEDFFLLHPSSMEKGIYQAGHYWNETLDSKYNTACIATYNPSNGTGSHICGSFEKWLFENSDMSADVSSSDDVLAIFDNIDKDVRYMISKGTLTDVISKYFTLKVPSDGSSPFTMTLAGEELTSKADGDNRWVFGTADDSGVYPYEVEYDKSSNSFKWIVNVPVENTKQITLSYDLLLGEEYMIDDKTYDTNESAVLSYVSTDGKYEGTYTFEVPKVHYTKEADTVDIEVTKVWDDDDDEAEARPDSITVNLMADGEQVDTAEITEDDEWKHTFEGRDKAKDGKEIEYTVEEEDVDDYESEVTGDADKGFTVTNTYDPEKGSSTKTDDFINLGLIIAIMAVSLALVILTRNRKKQKKNS